MAIVINGSGTVTGLAVGGLPDGTVDAGTLATDSVVTGKIADGTIANADIADLAASKLTGALPAISGASLTGISSAGGSDSFIAKLTNSQSIPVTTWTKLSMSNEVVDVGSNYDNSNYRYTVPDTGVYFVSISLVLPTMTGGADLCYLRIYVNGTQSGISDATESKSGGATGNAILQCHMVGLMALTAGQYIEAYVYETAGTRVAPTSGSAFCGFRLS